MTELQFQSPITFPDGWVRTPPKAAKIDQSFANNMSIEDAVRYLQDEVNSINAHKAVLHSNYDSLTNERMRNKKGHSEGVSLTLGINASGGMIACDKWYHVTQNIYALHLAVRHFRLFEDWGIATSDFLLGSFGEHSQNMSQDRNRRHTDKNPDWLAILGLGSTATLDDANVIYRHKAKLIAEDQEALLELNGAIEEARKHLRN